MRRRHGWASRARRRHRISLFSTLENKRKTPRGGGAHRDLIYVLGSVRKGVGGARGGGGLTQPRRDPETRGRRRLGHRLHELGVKGCRGVEPRLLLGVVDTEGKQIPMFAGLGKLRLPPTSVRLEHGRWKKEAPAARRGPSVRERVGRGPAASQRKGKTVRGETGPRGGGKEWAEGEEAGLRVGRGSWASATKPPGRGEGWPGFFFLFPEYFPNRVFCANNF